MKEMREKAADWLREHNWPKEHLWDGERHASCKASNTAKWRVMGFGYYLASDWRYRLYMSHRCPSCGIMVQHTEICDEHGNGEGIITRQVVTP